MPNLNGYHHNYHNNGQHLTNGALKYRNSICQYQPNNNGYTNPCLQASFDQISTISRPHSADVNGMNLSSSPSMHGRSNGFLSRGASSNTNGLYEDVDFQPTPRTLTKKKNIVWMRPHEICASPLFRLDPSSSILSTRELPEPSCKGDTNLLAAIGALSQMPRLLQRVVPPEQNFDSGSYTGMFRFRFWQYGRWMEVRIDDRLPMRGDRPAYLHSAQHDVFWVALLEKAYAKLYGGYGFLKYGTVGRAIQDLCGAVVQSVQPSLPLLSGSVPRSTLLVAISDSEKGTSRRRRFGLLTDHPYSITGLARVRTNTSSAASQSSGSSHDTNLVRLQSPWAGSDYGGMWGGAWSERSWEWNALNERDRELLASRTQEDGEFWMSVQDFLSRFVVVWLAHIGPEDWAFETALHTRAPWRAAQAMRQWRNGYNAGGPHKCLETTATNPQFRIRVPSGHHEKAHIVVAVAQSYECYRSRNEEESEIGFTIYQIPHNMPRLTSQFVSENDPLDVAPLTRIREIATFFALPPGDFVVLPHTQQHREGKFLLRIFADQHADVWEVNEDNMIIPNAGIDFPEDRLQDAKLLYKLKMKYPVEIDAAQLQALLKNNSSGSCSLPGFGSVCGPSLDLCRGLLALKDPDLSGRVLIDQVPTLVNLLSFWKTSFKRCGPSISTSGTLSRGVWASKISSYALRGLLWTAGVTASNKIIEAIAGRFTRSRSITLEGYILALIRIHLAQERFHSLESKSKSNPLTLEEMILMTIYS